MRREGGEGGGEGGRRGRERGEKWGEMKTRREGGTWEVEGGVECVRELYRSNRRGKGREGVRREGKKISVGGGNGGINGGGDMEGY